MKSTQHCLSLSALQYLKLSCPSSHSERLNWQHPILFLPSPSKNRLCPLQKERYKLKDCFRKHSRFRLLREPEEVQLKSALYLKPQDIPDLLMSEESDSQFR